MVIPQLKMRPDHNVLSSVISNYQNGVVSPDIASETFSLNRILRIKKPSNVSSLKMRVKMATMTHR